MKEIQTENKYLKNELQRLHDLLREQQSGKNAEVLTFKHGSIHHSDSPAPHEKSPTLGKSSFDFELEKGLQTKVIFNREQIRTEVRVEVENEFSDILKNLKNVFFYFVELKRFEFKIILIIFKNPKYNYFYFYIILTVSINII